MDYFYVPLLTLDKNSVTLRGKEAGHIYKVLRYKEGRVLRLLDGKGIVYEGVISEISNDEIEIKISGSISQPSYAFKIHMALGLLKKTDRIEWFIEKAVEIGVSEISIFYSMNTEKKGLNMERLQKIAIAALKQSGNPWLPIINEPISFSQLIKVPFAGEKYIGYCENETEGLLAKTYSKNRNAIVLIGPEGDFTKEEISDAHEAGFKKMSLGTNRLRSETAALAALLVMDTINKQ